MGKMRKRGMKMHLKFLREKAQDMRERKKQNGLKKLSALCKIVIKKYKLQNPVVEAKRIVEPTSFTVVGGKPLRKRRRESDQSTPSTSKPRDVKPGVKLGRPSGVKLKKVPLPGRGRPRKEPLPDIAVAIAAINPEPEVTIKHELDTPANEEQDPFESDAEDYTVVIKEELEVGEEKIQNKSKKSNAPRRKIIMPTLVASKSVGPSHSSLPSTSAYPPLMTVVADELQIFANSIAEQLRSFPFNRAMLLQLDIQTMIDNERQVMLDEH